MELENQRKEYERESLSKKDLLENPFKQATLWLEEALSSKELEPTAACLSTSTKEGKVSSRMILVKKFSEEGAIFFTHRSSKKGQQLAENPYASLLFHWKSMERQLIFEGPVTELSENIVAAYFAKRPRKSQLGSYASHQGEVLVSRAVLEEEYIRLDKKFEGEAIPVPPTWTGYALHPTLIEFWQGRASRLHDHFAYTKSENRWKIERISP